MPVFNEQVEVRRPWGDWIFLHQQRDRDGGGGFLVHNPWGHSNQPQGSPDRNRLEIGYRPAAGSTRWGQLVIHGPSGNVGLGLVNPRARLHVNGDVIVTGDIALPAADVAEEFAVTEAVEPGCVMVLGDDGALTPSAGAYDRKVAGVVSGAGGYRPGIVLDRGEENAERVTIAMVGKTFCKVDADAGAVAVGDLLTTAETPAHAMRASDESRAFGAILGKALRPLPQGRALVPILVALQ